MKRLVAILFVVACGGGGGDKKETTTPTTSAAVAADVVLTMQPASLSATVEGKPMELAIDASGQVKVNGELVATLTSAGEVKDTSGKTVATIAADGKVTIVGEPQEDIVIKSDGSLHVKGEAVLAIGADGILAGKLISAQDAQITYKGPEEAKRAVLFAWVIASVGTPDRAEPPAASTPPAPAP